MIKQIDSGPKMISKNFTSQTLGPPTSTPLNSEIRKSLVALASLLILSGCELALLPLAPALLVGEALVGGGPVREEEEKPKQRLVKNPPPLVVAAAHRRIIGFNPETTQFRYEEFYTRDGIDYTWCASVNVVEREDFGGWRFYSYKYLNEEDDGTREPEYGRPDRPNSSYFEEGEFRSDTDICFEKLRNGARSSPL